jgi:pimeloyl-ACP methyl ester carboxylesterase
MRYLLIILSTFLLTVEASDFAKEKRWIEQTVDAIFDGEAVMLQADGHEFLSIFTEAEDESDKGMIVIHGTGVHPNWGQVVHPVRVEMAARGWNTLSIQMPILANDASYEDYVPLYPEVPPRLKAAEDYLLAKGIKTIVIVAHSQGATMASYYLSKSKHRVSGFVAIGMGATQKDSHLNSANALESIQIPVLDIYGSEDLPGVLETSDSRKKAGAHNSAYEQKIIMGAGHFFDGKNEELIEPIDEWLGAQDL